MAKSCSPAVASMVKTTENSQTLRPNSSLRLAWRNGMSVMTRANMMAASQPRAPETTVAATERRTPRSREATHAMTRMAGSVVARNTGQKNQAGSVAATSPARLIIIVLAPTALPTPRGSH